ncbi:MAG: hypothetical protein ACC656_10090 [Candidatus Heimdallarchaeota archaeon]
MSKIHIEGDTVFSKEKITEQLLNLIKGRLGTIKKEIKEIQNDLEYFHKKFALSDEDFSLKFQDGILGDNKDYFVWKGSLDLLASLVEEENMLREVL